MKTTLLKWIGMLSILLLAFNNTHATIPQQQTELLLPLLLHDSTGLQTNASKYATATTIGLQLPVQHFVDEYLEEHSEMLEKIKQNNNSRFKSIQSILVKRGIPAELMYLAVVESKLKNNASSGAGAAGVWQLMPVTARILGLKVNDKTDERRYTTQSTIAAAKYLKELYRQFDDWLLVVAAYNCGAGNVNKAIKKSGSREFWKMQRHLPAETRTHVKRFIATHFYYEEKGSLVTLTKAERKKYLAVLNEIELLEAGTEEEKIPVKEYHQFNWIVVSQEQDEFSLLIKKE